METIIIQMIITNLLGTLQATVKNKTSKKKLEQIIWNLQDQLSVMFPRRSK